MGSLETAILGALNDLEKAGWVYLGFWGLGVLEYFDFLPGIEGREGDDGVPVDLKSEGVGVGVAVAVW